MLKEGRPCDSDKWEYYGGHYERKRQCDYDEKATSKEGELVYKDSRELIGRVKKIGVNWDKTKIPKSESHTVFNGTFNSETEYKECLIGTLVLTDGQKFLVAVEGADDTFQDFAVKLQKYMDHAKVTEEMFGPS